MRVRAKPILETPTQRQRDIHELTHLPPVPGCPSCVPRKAADDPHRRRQDARDSGLDVASFDHCDISTGRNVQQEVEVQGFGESQEWSSRSIGRTERTRDPIRLRYVGDVGFCCLCPQVSKKSRQRSLCRTPLSGLGNPRRFRETRPGIRMAVWVTVNQPSKRWRNRFGQRCFKCTLITTATVTSFPQSCRFFLDGETCCVDAHTVCARSLWSNVIFQVDEQGLPR